MEDLKKSYDDLNRCRKSFDKIQYPFMIKSEKIKYRKIEPQHSKGCA
jgi:hypothetical protein